MQKKTLETIAKVEPVQVKVWDIQVRAAARILEKGTQDDLITKVTETRIVEGGRDWMDHSAAWVPVKKPHHNTCLEEILAATGENGERRIEWDFTRERKKTHTLQRGDLGTKDTLQVVWEMRVRELEGIALALEKHTDADTHLLAIMTDSKPAIRTLEKLDSGTKAPCSAIEARIQKTLETRENRHLETYIAWVKGHKDIKGNEKADKLSKTTSILGHESEGVVTPAGLKAWARRERAKARGGSGQGVLGWHRKAISAYTWCVTEKGPQNKWWLHKIKKSDTPACRCQQEHPTQENQEEQSGEHLAVCSQGREVKSREKNYWSGSLDTPGTR